MLIALSAICVMMIIISSIKDSAMNPVRNAVGFALVPIQKGINAVGTGVYDSLKEIKDLKYAYEENEELSDRIGTLQEENNRLKAESLELERLRSLYALDQTYMQYPKVAARIIGKDSERWFQVFRIDKGSADGIQKDMNVLSGGGLCGIVTDVGANYATVRSIIDDESKVAAMSQHSGDNCFVKGNLTLFEEGLLDLTNIDKNANINDGDAIVTSNISTKFLPGLLIGYASDIQVDSQHLTKSGKLIPVADFDNLQEVLVITQLKTDSGIVDMSPEGILPPAETAGADALGGLKESGSAAGDETLAGSADTQAVDADGDGIPDSLTAAETAAQPQTPAPDAAGTEPAGTDAAANTPIQPGNEVDAAGGTGAEAQAAAPESAQEGGAQ